MDRNYGQTFLCLTEVEFFIRQNSKFAHYLFFRFCLHTKHNRAIFLKVRGAVRMRLVVRATKEVLNLNFFGLTGRLGRISFNHHLKC